MNFDEAIKAHSDWKLKLGMYISHPDGKLKADEVCQDNKCDLGKWIYSAESSKYHTMAEYQELKSKHLTFHEEAANIIRKADSGLSVAEDIMIGAQSAFGKISGEVIRAIMHMKQKA